jgi:hypothetical protein
MNKEAYYFSHDSNSRNDEKILSVRMRHGMEGYGIYFAILEKMRESSDYMLSKDYNNISFDLRVGNDKIKSVIEDFGLFQFTDDGKRFYSDSFLNRMKQKNEISEKKSEAGKRGAEKKWHSHKKNMAENSKNLDNNENNKKNDESPEIMANAIKIDGTTIAQPSKSIAFANDFDSKEKKGKERKIKEIKEEENIIIEKSENEKIDDVDDDENSTLFFKLEKQIFRVCFQKHNPTMHELQVVEKFITEYGLENVKSAFQVAVEQDVKKLAYVRSILNNQAKGINKQESKQNGNSSNTGSPKRHEYKFDPDEYARDLEIYKERYG